MSESALNDPVSGNQTPYRSPGGLDLIYEFVEDRQQAIEGQRQRPLVAIGILCYVVAATSLLLCQALTDATPLMGFSWGTWAFACVLRLGTAIFLAAIIHLFAESLGGKGRVIPLFVILGLCELVWALLLPAVFLTEFLFSGSAWVMRLLFLLVALWALALKVRCIRAIYRFGSAQAWASYFSPYLVLFITGALLFASMMWSLTSKIKVFA